MRPYFVVIGSNQLGVFLWLVCFRSRGSSLQQHYCNRSQTAAAKMARLLAVFLVVISAPYVATAEGRPRAVVVLCCVCLTLSSPSQKSCLPPFCSTRGVALSSSPLYNKWRYLPLFSSTCGVVFTIKEELPSALLCSTWRCLPLLCNTWRCLPLLCNT